MTAPAGRVANATELPLTSPWCQRSGRGRIQSWRHRSDGGFDQSSFEAVVLDEATAKPWVLDRHYSGTYPAGRLAYGMYNLAGAVPELVGVAVLSVPMNVRVLTRAFPQLTPYSASLELGRFVLADEVPGNGESWFIGRVTALAADAGVRGIVAYSDPGARTSLDGRVVFPGHHGTIYQAGNFRYCGRGTPRTHAVLPDGSVLSARALSKVRNDEQGHRYVERQLVAHGADPRRAGEPGGQWLTRALEQARVRRVRHAGNHVYCLRIGRTRAERSRVTIALQPRPYPKGPASAGVVAAPRP